MSISSSMSSLSLAGAAVVLLASCADSDRPASHRRTSNRPTSDRVVSCTEPGETLKYEAIFSPGTARHPVDTLAVNFRAPKPTSDDAERALRRCLQRATATVRFDYETLVNAWFNDDGPLPLTDGSRNLAYDPKTGKVQTWNEREGMKPVATKRRIGYIVEYQENKILVPPYGNFATIEVVFQKVPDEAQISTILAAQVVSAVNQQSTKLNTTAFAKSGSETDRVAREQIRGSSGVFLNIEFDPKSGRLRDQDGNILHTMR
jgi:hypothetical protein